MIDWLTIIIALTIITTLVGFFGFLAWKINMSDPLLRDNDNNNNSDLNNDKRKNEQNKKKRKDQKKSKRENKEEEEQQQQQAQKQQQKKQQRSKPLQTSEETDDEQEENELISLISRPLVESSTTSSKARKRNKNKARTATPPRTHSSSTSQVEENTKNRVPPVTQPKSVAKDEDQLNKQQKPKQQVQPTTAPFKKPTQQHEQPFTVVGANRQKTATPPLQQQQQQTKSQGNTTTTTTVVPVQQPTATQVQHEQLTQRQPAPVQPVKQQPQVPTVPPKVAELIKVLPSSQAVVTELMSALDAYPLSTNELDIIMHKIANKQSVLKQDWTKLQQGQKVDPQAIIGQVLDESAKAYEDEMKNNSMKRIKELTDELNVEKRRNNELLKEKKDKEREIEILHAQLDSVQHKQEPISSHPQQKVQTLELQLKRLTEDNIRLNQQLSQQQQQQLTTSSLTNTNDGANLQVQVLSEQIKKLSVDNANWEKKAHSNELLAKEAQKEKEDLIRYNEQLTQSLQNAEKDLKHIEEKHHKQFNESRTLHLNEINEYKSRIQQLETENEQLKREEIVHVEPSTTTDIQTITFNNEEREQLENEIEKLKQTINLNQQKESEYNELQQKLTKQIDEYQSKIDNLQTSLNQSQSYENDLRQDIERLKQEKTNDAKSRISQEQDKLRHILTDLLSEDLRNQLSNNNQQQDFDQWLTSYRQLFETTKTNSQEEITRLKNENDQLRKNMNEIENQLKDIEKTVQNKEETLFNELKNKDTIIETVKNDNERLRNDIQKLQVAHDLSVNEARALKHQLDERFLVAANTPSIVAADESFELVKQPSPSLSPIVVDVRGEQFKELMQSSNQTQENQDTQSGGLGETSTSNDQQS